MKNNEWRRPSTMIALILGAILGAAIGYYNGFFGWHDLKAILVLALVGSVVGTIAERARTDEIARKLFCATMIGGLIGIAFAVVIVSFSLEGKEYLIPEVINWCVSGIVVGLTLPTRLTLPMKIGAGIGLAVALLSGLNNFAQPNVEIGDVHLLINNRYVFVMIEAASGMIIGAWLGQMLETTFSRKEHA